MLKVYGVYRSRASRNYWLANEMGIEMERVPVMQGYRLPDPQAADAPFNTTSPGFLAITASGAIPAMDDDGFVLTESLAINMYIARKFGGPLAPADAREDALMLQWSLYGVTAIEAPALVILYANAQGRADTAEGRAEIAGAMEKLHRPFAVLNKHLAGAGHLVGGRFTVGDINMAEMVRYAQAAPGLMEAYPAVDAWLKACHARPGFQAMWAKRNAEPA